MQSVAIRDSPSSLGGQSPSAALLYRGELQYEDDGVLVVPMEKGLRNGCRI